MKVNVCQCKNGHYFDGGAYEVCPHCGAPASGMPSNQVETKKETYRPAAEMQNTAILNEEKPRKKTFGIFSELNNNFEETVKEDKFDPYREAGQSKPDQSFRKEVGQSKPDQSFMNESWQIKADPVMNRGTQDEKPKPKPEEFLVSEKTPQSNVNVSNTLTEVVQRISSSTEGKTMSYFSMAKKAHEKKDSIAANPAQDGSASKASAEETGCDPVVGWLVCVAGPNFGKDYRICAGINTIGRDKGNHIIVSGDGAISREKHALIIYEPKKMQFYLKPGDSSGLTYLNDEYISEQCMIKQGDIVELGMSKFQFVPLCGENFRWESFMES